LEGQKAMIEPARDPKAEAKVEAAFKAVGIDDTAIERRERLRAVPDLDEPPPHDRIPDGAAAERDTIAEAQGAGDFPGDKPWADRDKPRENAEGDQAPEPEMATLPPLTLDEWRGRDLPKPDFIMGNWLTTTTRVLMTAATGLGKTNFGLALAQRSGVGADFLHWKARRACRVLYIDGEMSRRLL
jgi:hypothetical protein